mmetsp:Transcript_12638/g.12448  ORF Transcript_12638/g.12448 Transcript_12638/m.12448 type:complete len:82 (+) Transcript_12638:388-633(+)
MLQGKQKENSLLSQIQKKEKARKLNLMFSPMEQDSFQVNQQSPTWNYLEEQKREMESSNKNESKERALSQIKEKKKGITPL